MTSNTETYRIICDNGGGMILQLGGTWAHYYQSADQLINDLADYLGGGNTSDWEGHEPEALECEPTDDEIRNGGYRVFSDIADLDAESPWANEQDIVKAIVAAKI